jgi:probable rRNA maturation factor
MSIFLADEQAMDVETEQLRSLAHLVVSEEGYPESTEVAILLVSEEEISGYNDRFLNRDGPTDVLAFPVETLIPGVVPDLDPHGPPLIAGDIVISPAYVKRQAESFGVSMEDEMALMVTHGVLHLLGYDHETDEEAEHMEQRERDLLAKVGRTRR